MRPGKNCNVSIRHSTWIADDDLSSDESGEQLEYISIVAGIIPYTLSHVDDTDDAHLVRRVLLVY